MKYDVRYGDLLAQDVDAIVNSWNRNVIPWWLLLPQGVSGAIKRSGGTAPFKELSQHGPIPLGEARLTGSGELAFKGIIHVAGINMFWLATKYSVTQSVINSVKLADREGFKSLALPLIGAGSGNRSADWSLRIIRQCLDGLKSRCVVSVIRYEKDQR